MAAFAGLRIGEIARLRVEDVDFEGNWIRVVSRPGFETKSGDDWKVPMHPRLHKMLEQARYGNSGWFFTAQPSRKFPQGDHHISPKRVNDDFIKVLESLDIRAGAMAGSHSTVFAARSRQFPSTCVCRVK